MSDAAASGAGETRRCPDVERSRHPRGTLTRVGRPTSTPRPGGVAAGPRAVDVVWFREVLDTLGELAFYLRTALRRIYLGGLTQAQAARQPAIFPAQLANHVAHGLQSVAALLTARASTPQAEQDTPESGPGFRS